MISTACSVAAPGHNPSLKPTSKSYWNKISKIVDLAHLLIRAEKKKKTSVLLGLTGLCLRMSAPVIAFAFQSIVV